MAMKLSAVCIALALALPLTALADAPTPANPGAVKSTKPAPPTHTPAHHKVKCCSGREQAQPKPPKPQQ